MPISYLRYELQDGYIHNWLVAGPQKIPTTNLARFNDDDNKQALARHFYKAESGVTELPVERGPLTEGTFMIGDFEGAWSYIRCLEDHFVDLSTVQLTRHYLRAWAYAQVELPTARKVQLVLTTNGPADVWLNDEHVHRHEHFHQQPHSIAFDASFAKGGNKILVRFEQNARRECPYAMALQIVGLPAGDSAEAAVRLPTTLEDVKYRNELEQIFEAAYLDQAIYAREDQITVRWSEELNRSANFVIRVQTLAGQIFGEARLQGTTDDPVMMGHTSQFPEETYRLVLMPDPEVYYEKNLRFTRELGFWCLSNNAYSDVFYDDFQKRRVEALLKATRCKDNVYAEIAKMAIGWWSRVKTDVIMRVIESINQHRDDRAVDASATLITNLIGLLGMIHRFGDKPDFPNELRQPLEACILGFRYWPDEPYGKHRTAPGDETLDYTTEHQSILFHTSQILAGQLYPDRIFTDVGQTGEWHREKGERLALDWLHKRGTGGFAAWDSPGCFADYLLAMSHLAEFAEHDEVFEMASVMMDNLFFQIAINSYKGVFGSTQGRTQAAFVPSGLLEATSGISRLMWGMGVFNHHIRGPVSLACMEEYGFPRLLQYIATDLPEEMWNRECHSPVVGAGEVNKVTYKTPDTMLCSAQDYHPGERGDGQHIWQATLGPAAVVTVTHPASASESGAHRTNFWRGNAILPRVAQWKDVLIAIHDFPGDDWLGFTHAYFPRHAFDEYEFRDGWAFARKGAGYLALIAAQGMHFIEAGPHAYRELRSYGAQNVWLCHMGRAALDGDFGAFQEKILALDVTFEGLSARCDTLRGESLAFGWQGPLLRNGEEQPITGFKRYENPYCVADWPAEQMDIQFSGQTMRLQQL